MKRVMCAIFVAAGLMTGPAAAGAWDLQHGYVQAQPQKSRGGYERDERGREGRDERREERRERLTEEERRALQRDLEKANRELYGRRPAK